jgi:2-oxoglutarate ferredoxin oxidoreductase subunit gamma
VEHCEIRFSGSGGQGLILSARILATALTLDGRKVAQSQSYEPTSRGGLSRSDLVVAQETVDYPLVTALDYLIILDQVAAHVSLDLLTKYSVVILDEEKVSDPPAGEFTRYSFPLTEAALELGNIRVTNIIALGILAGLGHFCSRASLHQAIGMHAPKAFQELNLAALERGYKLAEDVSVAQVQVSAS